ncbi:hypothetical protein O3M35_002443 [Rhynocoris fuscipes]|uniref:Uncharacterized protein n=1 Tax=Rhynocoris fuscipes TaxID=488301 RepID=A0AAW1CLE6_9HEMI
MSGREKKPLRQHSLDCGIKIPLRRQISEDIISKTAIQAGRQLKIAWTVEKIEPESEQVEIIAKKCGQPKPKPAVKPPRSPFAPDQNTVLFSRQQLTERLRSSWQKNSGSRHNLDIFLNRSVESENSDTGGSLPRTPDDSESSENEEEISRCIPPNGGTPVPAQSTPLPPPQITYQSDQTDTPKLCASARRMNFRNMGRQRSILESPCPTPEPGKATPTFKNINRQRVGDSSSSCASTPEPRKQLTRMMSAPPRSLPPSNRKLVKAPSMETPLLSPNQRVKSAPPKRKLRSAKKRTNGKHVGQDTSDDDGDGNAKGQGGGKRGARRGVDRGEVVTMVSLVSPAGTDSDEPTCIALPFPTPKQSASSTPVPKEELKPTPPPPIICLRKPLKSGKPSS